MEEGKVEGCIVQLVSDTDMTDTAPSASCRLCKCNLCLCDCDTYLSETPDMGSRPAGRI